MRVLAGLLLGCATALFAADSTDSLVGARRLAAGGTPQLALDLVDKGQPPDPGGARWAEWEALRCDLLVRLNRTEDLLVRAEHLPSAAAPLRECLLPAARAAAGSGKGAAARLYAARLIWPGGAKGEELRELRLLVIDSYVADRSGEDAYHSMLRFDLDYRPLETRTAARFVGALLDLGMAKEAVNWLASLDDGEPLKLMLRLQAGLMEPEVAIKLARPAALKRPGAGWWGVVARAANMRGNRVLQIEALEQLLQHVPPANASRGASSRDLWQAYLAAARETAEQNKLLSNDDAAWGKFAASRFSTEPIVARAVLAHLARHGATPGARTDAQLQLEASLQLAKLDLAALRLLGDGELDVTALDPRLRYSLGEVGESHGLHAAAVRMWQGLPPPPGFTPFLWQLRVGAAMVRAGQIDAGVGEVTRAVASPDPWPPAAAKRASALAREFLNAGHPGAAEPLLAALAQRTQGLERRQAYFDLGRTSDAAGKPLAAAEHYLRAATAEAKSPDALARQARLAAGLSLARGGYRDDARAQFEWVLKNSRDPAQLDIARRELKNP